MAKDNSEPPSRRLAAILAADIAGYSRLMGADEEGTVRALKGHQAVILPMISEAGGRVIDTAGDGILAEFTSVLAAVNCAMLIQQTMEARNEGVVPENAMRFRIGVNLGDIVFDEARIYGDGINVASRLQALAEPGGVVVSRNVHDELRERIEGRFEDLGERELKNIARPVRVFALQSKDGANLAKTSPSVSPLTEQPALAVLPFTNMSGDPEQDYFADGITEDIIAALTRVKWFSVIAHNSSFTYKNKGLAIRRVGRELGVRYVVEGSVRKSGTRLRITAQLIEAENGRHVWADKFDGELSDVFELQDRVTEGVVGAMEPSLRAVEIERSQKKPTSSLVAYDYVLRALPNLMLATTRANNLDAIGNLRKAIEIDPQYTQAKAYLAAAHTLSKAQGWSSTETEAEGIACAESAIAAQSDDPTTLAAAGSALAHLGERIDEGLRSTERAYAINPNSTRVLRSSGWVNYCAGNGQTSIQRFERALRLSPIDPEAGYLYSGLSHSLFLEGRFDEGVKAGRLAIAEAPLWTTGYRALMVNLVQLGLRDEARAVVDHLLKLSPGTTIRTVPRSLRQNFQYERYLAALRLAGLPE